MYAHTTDVLGGLHLDSFVFYLQVSGRWPQ